MARRGLGSDPTSRPKKLIPTSAEEAQGADQGKRAESASEHGSVDAKVRTTVYLPESLAEYARDAVVALEGPPVRLSLSALVEAGVRAELERLEAEHNDGKPFEHRGTRQPKAGRRVSG